MGPRPGVVGGEMISRKDVLKKPVLAESVFSRPTRVVMLESAIVRSSATFSRNAILVCWIAGRESGHLVEESN